MTNSLRGRYLMMFAGYDHRCCAKVPCGGTKEAEFGSIAAERYTLQRLSEQISTGLACLRLAGD
ncbi:MULTISPECIES: hypothetical protein [Pseudomonas]|uniref:hypothetical protein n=1 Tax=Pseudomonas TaxID=286 RepID=UPI000CACC176|nr:MULTISPECIES: hypothetical protein [Pseudomonas]PMZ38951.1 hypothetical protein C1Y00_19420 [Pseudomonas sp. FW306-2-11AB]PMZ57504.1 hypothetical protein C1X96_19755 [Pseudomonas sp. FW300-N1A5]PNB14550.1 hypothetical protein C1X98_18450 [Pseudomonas sp. FW306-2-11BA]